MVARASARCTGTDAQRCLLLLRMLLHAPGGHHDRPGTPEVLLAGNFAPRSVPNWTLQRTEGAHRVDPGSGTPGRHG
eukprot:4297710-Alexandrium_andersonii.AAC.1